jgi:hypothetical protein
MFYVIVIRWKFSNLMHIFVTFLDPHQFTSLYLIHIERQPAFTELLLTTTLLILMLFDEDIGTALA